MLFMLLLVVVVVVGGSSAAKKPPPKVHPVCIPMTSSLQTLRNLFEPSHNSVPCSVLREGGRRGKSSVQVRSNFCESQKAGGIFSRDLSLFSLWRGEEAEREREGHTHTSPWSRRLSKTRIGPTSHLCHLVLGRTLLRPFLRSLPF